MTTNDRHQFNRQLTRQRHRRQAKRQETARWKQRIANSVAVAVATLCVFGARSLFAEPADVLDTSGTISEAKAPAGTNIEVGDGSVSTQTGAFQYSFPIAVPPGRMGAQPSVSLSYSSQSAKHGGVAEGWSLSLPTIEADFRAEADLTGPDTFVWRSEIAGSRELVASTDPAPGGWESFRAQSDPSFARYQQETSTGVFRVLSLDGSVLYFGESGGVFGGGLDDWKPLTRTVDKHGNEVLYRYQQVSNGNGIIDQRLFSISYGSNPDAGMSSGHAEVQFHYDQPLLCGGSTLPVGARLSFRGGFKRVFGHSTLSSISTSVDDGSGFRTVREYDLGYDLSKLDCAAAEGPRRQLKSITASATSPTGVTTSMPPVTFSYAGQPSLGPTQLANAPASETTITPSGSIRVISSVPLFNADLNKLIDLNGDGRLDWVEAESETSCALRWYPNLGVTSAGDISWGPAESMGRPRLQWDGNGSTPGDSDEYCTLNGQFSLWRHADAPDLEGQNYAGAVLMYQFRDFDGDGFVDLLTGVSGVLPQLTGVDLAHPYRPDPNRCQPNSAVPGGGPEWEPGSDVDDPVTLRRPMAYANDCFGWKAFRNQPDGSGGRQFSEYSFYGAPFPIHSEAREGALSGQTGPSKSPQTLTDMNGDGFLDYVRVAKLGTPSAPTYSWWIYPWDVDAATTSNRFHWISEGDARATNFPSLSGKYDLINQPNRFENKSSYRTSDVNGDGLPDWNSLTEAMYNIGGFEFGPVETFSAPSQHVPPIFSRTFVNASNPVAGFNVSTYQTLREDDFNYDGRPDVLDANNSKVYYGLGDGNFVSVFRAESAFQTVHYSSPDIVQQPPVFGDWRIYDDVLDLNGDGLSDRISTATPNGLTTIQWAQPDNGPPGSLTSIDNGHGLIMDVAYAPHTDPNVVTIGDGEMPSTHWVVDTLTAQNPVGGTPDSTTTYRYDTPVRTDDYFGKRGFRGFMNVTTTGPTGSKSVEGYDYSFDWSGRRVSSKIYAAGSTNPHTISQSEFVRKIINVGGSFGTWNGATQLEVFLPERAESWLCEYAMLDGSPATYDEATCLATAESRLQLTKYAAGSASHANPIATFDGKRMGANIANGFLVENEYDSLSGSDVYRQVVTSSQSLRGDASWSGCTNGPNGIECDYSLFLPQNTTLSGRTETQHDASMRYATRVCMARSVAEIVGGTIDTAEAPCTGYEYDLVGNVIKEQAPEQYAYDIANGGQPFQGDFTEVIFDSRKLYPSSVENALGHKVISTTDYGTGATLSSKGPNFSEGSYKVIDGFGRPLQEWVSTGDHPSGLINHNFELFRVLKYNDLTLPNTVEESLSRSPADEITLVDNYDNSHWIQNVTEFDGAGRVLKQSENDLADPNDITPYKYSTYAYDNAGRLISTDVPNPQTGGFNLITYQHSYDSLNRKTCTVAPNGSGVATVTAGRLYTTTEFGSDGGTCANPNGGNSNSPQGAKRVETDIFDRISYVEEKIDNSQPWAKTEYAYDDNNNIASIKRIEAASGPSTDDILTEMAHDFAGNRLEINRHGRVWSYAYDRNGNMLTQTAPTGTAGPGSYTTSVVYDVLNRPTSRMAANADLAVSVYTPESLGVGVTMFEYDGGPPQGTFGTEPNSLGRLTKTTLPFGIVTTAYDARGNVSSQTRDIDLSTTDIGIPLTDSLTSSVEKWNSFGQPLDATEASGQQTHTHYVRSPSVPRHVIIRGANLNEHEWFINFRNAAGLVYRTQHFKRLNNVPKYGRNVHVNRDNLGRVTREYSGDTGDNKIDQQFTFYGTSEIETHKSQVGPITNTRNFTYTYDNQHQLVSAFDDKGFDSNYTYTRTGRLETAYVAAGTGAGTMVTPRNVAYDYDLSDPEIISSLTDIGSGATFADFLQDAAGNVIQRDLEPEPAGGPVFNLIYDGDNRLRVRTLPDGSSETYFYANNARWLSVRKDSLGATLSATQWMGATEILYDCTGGSCNRTEERTTVTLGGRSVARVETNVASGDRDVKMLHSNGLGHLLGVYEHSFVNGQLSYELVAGFQYSPFGEILETTEAAGTPSLSYLNRFNGKHQDLETGLSYYGYRYYDPLTQTWNRTDPLFRFEPEIAYLSPRRGNLFTFSGNNPLRYMDPDGRDPSTLTLKVVLHPDTKLAQDFKNGIQSEELKALQAGTNAYAERTTKITKITTKVEIIIGDTDILQGKDIGGQGAISDPVNHVFVLPRGDSRTARSEIVKGARHVHGDTVLKTTYVQNSILKTAKSVQQGEGRTITLGAAVGFAADKLKGSLTWAKTLHHEGLAHSVQPINTGPEGTRHNGIEDNTNFVSQRPGQDIMSQGKGMKVMDTDAEKISRDAKRRVLCGGRSTCSH